MTVLEGVCICNRQLCLKRFQSFHTELSSRTQVFIWVGSRCSDVEVKLAYKSAQVYVQNLRIKQPDRPRQLMLTFKGKESRKFTKCFHGWSKKQVEYRVITLKVRPLIALIHRFNRLFSSFQNLDPRIEYLQNKQNLPNEETA